MASAIRAAGQELVASGVSTDDALDRLAAQAPRWSTIGANQAQDSAGNGAPKPAGDRISAGAEPK